MRPQLLLLVLPIVNAWSPSFFPFRGYAARPPQRVHSVEELHQALDNGVLLEELDVLTQGGSPGQSHPVMEAIRARMQDPSRAGSDGYRIGLAIEGGGMRGCVSAGAVSALHYLGLQRSIDAVYGSSAGSLVGAFFVAGQERGTDIYLRVLTTAGSRFIDKLKIPGAIIGPDFFPSLADEWFAARRRAQEAAAAAAGSGSGRGGSGDSGVGGGASSGTAGNSGPIVISLDFLLEEVVGRIFPLDWDSFWKNNQRQPLHVVVTGLRGLSSLALSSKDGHFSSLADLQRAMRASMLVPGLTGPPVAIPHSSATVAAAGGAVVAAAAGGAAVAAAGGAAAAATAGGTATARGGTATVVATAGAAVAATAAAVASAQEEEPCADALICEPIPYRSAVADGCTHVLVLRTRPDGRSVLGKRPGLYEGRVARRFFENAHGLPHVSEFMLQQRHLLTYAEDVLLLAAAAATGQQATLPAGGAGAGRRAHVVALAPGAASSEINQLETAPAKILQGCRDGFEAAWEAFAPLAGRGDVTGADAAAAYFPVEAAAPFDLAKSAWHPGKPLAEAEVVTWPAEAFTA